MTKPDILKSIWAKRVAQAVVAVEMNNGAAAAEKERIVTSQWESYLKVIEQLHSSSPGLFIGDKYYSPETFKSEVEKRAVEYFGGSSDNQQD